MRQLHEKVLILTRKIPVWTWILMFCVLAYGLLVPWLGFYLDDWYIVYFQKLFGAGEFTQFFKNDRPLFAYVYMLFVPIFKDSALGWQIFAVLTHAMAGFTFWWLLKKLLPKQQFLTSAAAVLFTVYPGFTFHWFSVMYSQVFFLMAVYFGSLILMIEGIERQKGRGWWLLGAVICQVIGIVPQEYFFGLEFLRPVIIWIVIAQTNQSISSRFKKCFYHWLPFLLVAAGFLIFRISYSTQFSYQVNLLDDLRISPGMTIIDLMGNIFWIVFEAVIRAWTSLVEILKQNMLTMNGLKITFVFCAGLVLAFLYLKRVEVVENDLENKGRAILVGLFSTAVATFPFLASSYTISLEFPYNRFLIALAPGASVALAAAIDFFLRKTNHKIILGSILVGMAVVSQFNTARLYKQNWKSQGDLFWQLYWRAPVVEPGTVFVTDNLPIYLFSSGQSLTAPLNLFLAEDLSGHNMPYALIMTASPQVEAIPSFTPDQEIKYEFRSMTFQGNTSQMLVIDQPSNGCVRVYSPTSSIYEFRGERYQKFWEEAVPLSNLSVILDAQRTNNALLERYFGKEDQDSWCYYYEKAELANQYQHWQDTIRLYSQAEEKGLSPILNREWLPLLRASLNLHDVETASIVVENLLLDNLTTAEDFCTIWKEAQLSGPDSIPFEASLQLAKCEK